jgi:MFS family permease
MVEESVEAQKAAEEVAEHTGTETSQGAQDAATDISLNVPSPSEAGVDASSDSASAMRWVVLFSTCLVMTCVYYSLDLPAALHQELKDYMEDGNADFELAFNLLYTVYSFPNVILPFFGGSLVDKFGSALCLTFFASLCAAGQFMFAIGASYKSWKIMLLGRTIYGFGGESICVAYSTLLSEWFAGKELALSFGIALAIARLGSVLNDLISPVVANSFSTPWALWVGVALNVLSVVVALYIRYLDSRYSTARQPSEPQRDSANNDNDLTEPLLVGNQDERQDEGIRPTTPALSILQFGPLFWLLSLSCLVVYACILPWNNVASGILLERNFFQAPPEGCQLLFPDQCTMGTLQNHSNPSLDRNNNTCPGQGFAPVVPTSLNFSSSNDQSYNHEDEESLSANDIDCDESFWSDGCTRDYCNALHKATETSGRVMSIPYIISACLSPLLGRMIDRIGRRATIASLASILLVAVHSSLALTRVNPVVPLIGQGIGYALYSSVLWPSVTLTVDKELIGTAFGTITSIQNIGLGLFPIVVAAIYNRSGQRYIPHVEVFFACCAVIGSFLGIFLILLDRRTGNKLNSIDGKGDVAVESIESLADSEAPEQGSGEIQDR